MSQHLLARQRDRLPRQCACRIPNHEVCHAPGIRHQPVLDMKRQFHAVPYEVTRVRSLMNGIIPPVLDRSE
jgi:hypothetical protein